MKLRKVSSIKPNFEKLYQMLDTMESLLEDEDTDFTLEELCSFQDESGSFSLFESNNVPNETIVDFINTPSYIGSSILMKEYLSGNIEVKENLEKGLNYTFETGFKAHSHEMERTLIENLNIFLKGGLLDFLEKERETCPKFHCMIHNIIHKYNSNLINGKTLGSWGEDYRENWESITKEIKLNKRLYLAYGSNMNKNQMHDRCPDANIIGKTYLEDWELTMPFYANIEPNKREKTPALIWEISNLDEKNLDIYEGYPNLYDKKELIIDVEGKTLSVMAYIMTAQYKNERKIPREDYIEGIIKGYEDAGFNRYEFKF